MNLTAKLTVATAALAASALTAPADGLRRQGGACCPTVAPTPPGRFAAPLMGYPPPDAPLGRPCPPVGPPAPLLAMRVLAPAGTTVTLLPGTPTARTFPTPITAGFRPGYAYRLALGNLPGRPADTLYPTLEVRASVVPRANMNYMEFAAPILITAADIEKAFAGGTVAKVVYLEDPTRAIPVATTPDQPLESTDDNFEAALKAATENGRLVAVLRFGDRAADADELAQQSVANTVLFPGEVALGPAGGPPIFGWCGQPLYDPILGPKFPGEECLTDGGDKGTRLGVGPMNRVAGLDPTDVSAAYTVLGKRRVTTSNEVCVCSPRFCVRRTDLTAGGLVTRAGLDAIWQYSGRHVASTAAGPGSVGQRERAVVTINRERPSLTIMVNGVAQLLGLSRPQLVASRTGLLVVGSTLEVEEITSFPNDLTVTKSVEPAGAVQPGDEVTFTIRYRNGLPAAVSDVVLTDSLSGRLQYVEGSAKSDRPTNVTTVPNAAGSVEVRFEVPGPIPPGGTGVVTFRAKVR